MEGNSEIDNEEVIGEKDDWPTEPIGVEDIEEEDLSIKLAWLEDEHIPPAVYKFGVEVLKELKELDNKELILIVESVNYETDFTGELFSTVDTQLGKEIMDYLDLAETNIKPLFEDAIVSVRNAYEKINSLEEAFPGLSIYTAGKLLLTYEETIYTGPPEHREVIDFFIDGKIGLSHFLGAINGKKEQSDQ